MDRTIAAMQARMHALGVTFRQHVKTTECIEVVRAQGAAGAARITVSTLKEAEDFFAAGVVDMARAIVPTGPLHFGFKIEVEATAVVSSVGLLG